ncbi:MAG: 1-(5-phosphoribosyl)-5-[(5-phosphoribosylamino)methylideneamino]imidazole-4-carboxamide isomerase [Verrucomicrobiae bacterium]|nr:1-(5-phosphoribosyl)-5-[(5-phosphoribosylamino)methylideneamino]imidazole-4-carboxamide isomerase [Verrucomicrobiae bacterium]
MTILPAIDLMNGKVVRLQQGRADAVKVYSEDPVAIAQQWESQGAQWLHLVDLDGAFSGEPKNLKTIQAITQAISIPCELGGGLRKKEDIQAAFEVGVIRVALGSKAVDSLEFVQELVAEFGSEKIAVGIDAKNGQVAVKGWTEISSQSAEDFARIILNAGVGKVIYTDIATDGMLQGPNLLAMRAMAKIAPDQLIASGGVSRCEDIENLSKIPGVDGVIVGKALYDNKVTLPELLKAAQTN